ncbi:MULTISPECIES: DUF4168 domain-containing protein [Sphingobium]|uniref:DUF4168 domain-containing protein n=1 Tax=Sphingobium TaxID=165695 RepID=UPI0015EC6617|nr:MULTISPECIES: DUF4168 domain-containing protein [Sphingobium]MCW2363580.1 hypothetical protein [Sphingobium sp. B10D3B]MCW2383404.1 hypothetical protein [Sphingobium sp. B2D3B]MCW2396131.1 hypothetical protein [Sphingobium sp. B8D3B]MCW2399621.1 hypothetical protein [Sphingobium sp. B2D3C]MCW2403022.1 hypothetical protein [Sphingobium sp. B10D7B]
MKSSLLYTAALLLSGGIAVPAMAQDTAAPATAQPAAPASPASPAAPASPATPAAPATAAAPTSFTDAELVGFAKAAIQADKIQKDATVAADAKQEQMLAAVQSNGLTPARYNEIAQATRTNPDLVKKIQELASADMATQQPATANP